MNKLHHKKVSAIIRAKKAGMSYNYIKERYGVSTSTAFNYVHNKKASKPIKKTPKPKKESEYANEFSPYEMKTVYVHDNDWSMVLVISCLTFIAGIMVGLYF